MGLGLDNRRRFLSSVRFECEPNIRFGNRRERSSAGAVWSTNWLHNCQRGCVVLLQEIRFKEGWVKMTISTVRARYLIGSSCLHQVIFHTSWLKKTSARSVWWTRQIVTSWRLHCTVKLSKDNSPSSLMDHMRKHHQDEYNTMVVINDSQWQGSITDGFHRTVERASCARVVCQFFCSSEYRPQSNHTKCYRDQLLGMVQVSRCMRVHHRTIWLL